MNKPNRRYRLPSPNDVALKSGLSTRLKELWASATHNSFELFLYAAALRKRYLSRDGQEYSPEFSSWYQTQELHTLFGKLPSFTRYALAGEAVNFFANKFCEGKYIAALPVTRTALYELWLLTQQISESDLEKLFFSGGADDERLIQPSTSAAEIAAHRNRLEAKPHVTNTRRNRKFTIPLATIYVSRDLYKFNKKTGAHEGTVDLDATKDLLRRLADDLDTRAFDIRSNIKKVISTYEKRKSKAEPSRALRKAAKPNE